MPKPQPLRFPALDHFLFTENTAALDRYQSLFDEDDELRHAEYDRPDPKRRRLRVMCNDCETPWCCNQRVDMELVQAMVLYRWAAANVPVQLAAAIARGKEQRGWKEPLTEAEFFHKKMSCPFLVKGRCSVYAARPHPCRTHYMGGNPSKCRDELQPSETYAMDPDGGLIAEMARIADDVKFFALIEDVEPTELCETLHFIDELASVPKWKKPGLLDWRVVDRQKR